MKENTLQKTHSEGRALKSSQEASAGGLQIVITTRLKLYLAGLELRPLGKKLNLESK